MTKKYGKLVWITGASTGIGCAAALELARRGYNVAASARSADKLEALVEQSADLAGDIYAYPCDVSDEKAVQNTIMAIEKEIGRIDVALLNAGTYLPDNAETFSAEIFKTQMDVNVMGVVYAVDPLLKIFLKREQGEGARGHIAIVSSVAGYRGLPRSLSYGPTKAALINMAESLAAECHEHNIKIQIINPGFVKTPLTDKNDFHMPMLMDVDKAALALVRGLESNRFEITFPWLFAFLTKISGRLLPNAAYLWVMRRVKAVKGNP